MDVENLSLQTRLKLWWKRLTLSWRFRFAHHPLCARFSDQIFVIKGLYLCQGCTLVYTGFFLALLIVAFLPFQLLFYWWVVIIAAFVFPTFIIQFISLPRLFKRLARFLFGIGLGTGVIAAFKFSQWFYILGLISIVLIVYLVFRILYRRNKKAQEDICGDCPELHQRGVCSGFKLQMEAERKYSEYASKLLESELEELVQRKIHFSSDF